MKALSEFWCCGMLYLIDPEYAINNQYQIDSSTCGGTIEIGLGMRQFPGRAENNQVPHSLKLSRIKSSGPSDFLYTDASIWCNPFRLPHINRKTDLEMT